MGGGSSTNTIQPSPMQNTQAALLQSMAPMILQNANQTMPLETSLQTNQLAGQNSILPNLQSMLTAAGSGAPTSQQQQNLMGTQQQVRQQSANMGIQPTDPRLGQSFQQGAEGMTKGSLPEIQSILSLFGSGQGMNPATSLGMMGGGASAGSTSTNNPAISQQVGSGMSTAALLGMLGNQMGLFNTGAGIGAGSAGAGTLADMGAIMAGTGAASAGTAGATAAGYDLFGGLLAGL